VITIRHARLDEKKKTYEWLCLSDTTGMCMGPPDYPEHPVPDWKQFQEDFEDFYYCEAGQHLGSVMIIENDNEGIGCLCYACFHLRPKTAELDIWLNRKEHCGKGWGTVALRLLVKYLKTEKDIAEFIIRPSEKNIRAIRAYEKAGFSRAEDKERAVKEYLLEGYLEKYGNGDYGFDDTAVLVLE
jgi:RimJ/RimL family protein N-acetyltransferase